MAYASTKRLTKNAPGRTVPYPEFVCRLAARSGLTVADVEDTLAAMAVELREVAIAGGSVTIPELLTLTVRFKTIPSPSTIALRDGIKVFQPNPFTPDSLYPVIHPHKNFKYDVKHATMGRWEHPEREAKMAEWAGDPRLEEMRLERERTGGRPVIGQEAAPEEKATWEAAMARTAEKKEALRKAKEKREQQEGEAWFW